MASFDFARIVVGLESLNILEVTYRIDSRLQARFNMDSTLRRHIWSSVRMVTVAYISGMAGQ